MRLITALLLTPLFVVASVQPAMATGFASALRDTELAEDLEPAPSVDEEQAEARAAYTAGTREYALGNYDVAVSHFERSFELSQAPELLFNIAQSYARWYEISNDIEHLRKAQRLFKNYVGHLDADDRPDPAAKADAEEALAQVEQLIASHEEKEGDGTRRPRRKDDDRPLHKKGWFWAAVIGGAALIGGGIAAGVVLSRPSGKSPELGKIGAGPSPGGLSINF